MTCWLCLSGVFTYKETKGIARGAARILSSLKFNINSGNEQESCNAQDLNYEQVPSSDVTTFWMPS